MRNRISIKILLMLFVLLAMVQLCSIKGLAAVKLPAIFSDHMVLQQSAAVAIWGWADTGEAITVKANWSNKRVTAVAVDGRWKLQLKTPAAGGPYTITIAGNNTIVLSDVMIGEVWVASGQSNMGFSLKGAQGAKEEIASADLPQIRFFNVKRQYGRNELDDAAGSQWQLTSPATAGSFSAVAYYFAKKIHNQLKVPVGIVFAAWGGTPAEAWTPSTTLRTDSALSVYLTRWRNMYATVGEDSSKWHLAVAAWEGLKKKDPTSTIKKPEEPWTLVSFNRPWREPAVLFNGLINPVIPYTIKGVLWYQGESNVNFATEYYHLFSSMIGAWRRRWNNSKLPFYFVQLAPYKYANMHSAALLRDAQYQVTMDIRNTGMAVTTDVGNMNDIHPTKKREPGERLALIALARDYKRNLIYKGPEISTASVKDNQVVLQFKAASPLKRSGDTLKGFELGVKAGDSVIYQPVAAMLHDDKVIININSGDVPVAVRYGWLLIDDANLSGSEGLPAVPFAIKLNRKK